MRRRKPMMFFIYLALQNISKTFPGSFLYVSVLHSVHDRDPDRIGVNAGYYS